MHLDFYSTTISVPFSGGIKGGGHGGICPPPPVGGSSPHLPPPVRRKKWPKSAIFGNFLDFCSLRVAFFPLDAPHKKFSGAATGSF